MSRMLGSAVRERWKRLVELQCSSDLSVADFARRYEISAASLYQWRHKLSSSNGSARAKRPKSALAKTRVQASASNGGGGDGDEGGGGKFLPVKVTHGSAAQSATRAQAAQSSQAATSAQAATRVRFGCGTELELPSGDHASLAIVLDRLCGGRRT